MRGISCSSWPRPITDIIIRRGRRRRRRRRRRLAPRLALGRRRPDAHIISSRKIAPSAALRFGSSRAHPGRDAHLAGVVQPRIEFGQSSCATRRARASRRGRITGIALVVARRRAHLGRVVITFVRARVPAPVVARDAFHRRCHGARRRRGAARHP